MNSETITHNLGEFLDKLDDEALHQVYAKAQKVLHTRYATKYRALFRQCLDLMAHENHDISTCGISAATAERPCLLHIAIPIGEKNVKDLNLISLDAAHLMAALDNTQNFKLEVVYNHNPMICLHLEIPSFVPIPGISDKGEETKQATVTTILEAIAAAQKNVDVTASEDKTDG